MSQTLWPDRARPVPGPGATTVGRWAPADPADLTAHRRQLAAALGGDAGAPGAADVLLLAFEELVGNALRHGREPVDVAVTAFDGSWLLEVSDAAVDRPPTPVVGRDAARGGMGLRLVARTCAAYGWQSEGHRKTVWACVDRAGAESQAAAPGAEGVAGRLAGLAAGFSGALGFAPDTRLLGPVGLLPSDVVIDLLAVLREALTNVERHAHAGSVTVEVVVSPDSVSARVTDDGVGMAGAPRDGGLADLRRRAAWHDGSLTVGPGPAGGTRLVWSAPYRPVASVHAVDRQDVVDG